MLLGYVLTSHELWGSSCEGILRFACYGLLLGALLSTWVFAICFLRGYLCFASCVGICASRGVLTLMTANWPLMVVNAFWLALLAMVVNAFWLALLAMVVNGFATAWLWEWSLMLRASHAEGRFVGLCFLRGYLRFARGFDVNDRQLAVNASQWFLACFARYGRQCFLCEVWRQWSLMVLPQRGCGDGR